MLNETGELDHVELTESRLGSTEYSRYTLLAFARGVYTICANALDADFRPVAEIPFPGGDHRKALVDRSCDYCGSQIFMSVGEALLYDPDLIAFCHERGLDVTTTPTWELEFAKTDRYVTVRSTDPWEVSLELTLDEETLELIVDDDMNVIERNGP